MPSAADEIREAITASPSGAVPFEEFMRLALYGAHGFYTGPVAGGAGRRRDFLTSPEVGPLFGALVARLLDDEWRRLGQPDPFVFVDLGAGHGTLSRAVAVARPECAPALRHVAVDASAAQRAEHPDHVESLASFDDVAGGAPFTGLVIASELLDNVPFALAVHDGAWREAFVADGDGGRFVEVLSAPLDPATAALPAAAAHGARLPIQRGAARLVETVLGRLTGSLVVLDYCRATSAEVALLPWRDWLRTYRAHGRGGHYLDEPGTMDITCDVVVDQLPPPDRVIDQASFLAERGIDELVEEGRQAWIAAAAAAPSLEALRMRSRVREAEALVEPEGLGGFSVLTWRR